MAIVTSRSCCERCRLATKSIVGRSTVTVAREAGRNDRLKVLLIWPGGLFSGGANFGVPQLLSIASALRRDTEAQVEIVDLDMERAFGRIDLSQLVAGGYDLVGISCYSSYDYLKIMAIGTELRRMLPQAWLVTGGYHPSARPADFTRDDSPFDYVVIGDGEAPMAALVKARQQGKRPAEQVIGPAALADPNDVEYDWSLLERYLPVARQVASQAEIYLSRGCPFDCSFCMERAKREVAWRPLDPERAVEEVHRLDRFVDLSRWTLFVSDALFGMKSSWRKTFLEGLARRPCRARKLWLLTRVDLIDKQDIELMARANVSPGFGLESGDPDQLKRIRKTGKLEHYFEQMQQVAGWALDFGVPFGANVIFGHPGETEQTMRNSAAFLEKLFLGDPRGTSGFLSVDPFRLYPGSPIDESLAEWERNTGMRAHRYPWWEDGDQDFLAEWIDPSDELDFRRTLALRRELFDPILLQIGDRFRYDGPARDYYQRAIDEQVALCAPRRYLHTIGMWHLWRSLTGADRDGVASAAISGPADDDDLQQRAREARIETLERCGIQPAPALREALATVPRERYVDFEHIGDSAADEALPLTDDGGSTISALHAYVLAFEALELGEGDQLTDLGAGTGYGAALASEVVGGQGRVLALEYEPSLAAIARRNLAAYPQAEFLVADAHRTELWEGASKVYVAFAIERLPEAWIDALAETAKLVAPVADGDKQMMTLFCKTQSGMDRKQLGPVLYVPDRAGGGESTSS